MSRLGWSECNVAAVHILLVTTLMAMPAGAAGQTAGRPWGFWAAAGLGPATPYEFSIAANAVVRYNRLLVRVRYASAEELFGNVDEDVGVLLGVVLTPVPSRGQLAVGAGVGRVSGSRRGCFLCGSRPIPSAAGFLLDMEGRLALTGFFGIDRLRLCGFELSGVLWWNRLWVVSGDSIAVQLHGAQQAHEAGGALRLTKKSLRCDPGEISERTALFCLA